MNIIHITLLILLTSVNHITPPLIAILPNQQFLPKMARVDSDKSLGDIAIGMNQSQVMKLLGKPRRIITTYDGCVQENFRTFVYKQLEVVIQTDRVLALRTSSPRYATSQGIKVGDSISKVKSTYDQIFTPLSNSASSFSYEIGGRLLTFGYRNNKITTIEIFQDNC
jgi:hypothetical protein